MTASRVRPTMMTTTMPRPLGIVGRVVLLAVLAFGLFLARLDPFTLFFYSCYAAIGAVLAIRRPGNGIGWLLVAIAFGFIGTTTELTLDVTALQDGIAPMDQFLAAWGSAWSGYATFGGFVALTLLFPSGRLPGGRWRRPAIAMLGACVLIPVVAAVAPRVGFNPSGTATVVVPNRFAVLPDLAIWSLIPLDSLIVPVVILLLIGVISMLTRYRRATGVERLQLRWLVAALAFMVGAVIAGLTALIVFGEGLGGLAWLPAIVAYPMIPAAIYVAITRYRLYEIDRVISRTVGWLIVTAMLAGLFAVAIVGLQAILAPVTDNNTLAVAGSTLVAASLFQPLRRRVQRAVDSRFNRSRVSADATVAAFAGHVRNEVDLPTLRTTLVATANAAVEPIATAVWLRGWGGSTR